MVHRLVIGVVILILSVIACNRGRNVSESGVLVFNPDNEAWEDSLKFNNAIELQKMIKKSVSADCETDPVQAMTDQDSADDPAIFNIGNQTYIAGSNKLRGIHLYDLSGKELAYFNCGKVNNIDSRVLVTEFGDSLVILGATNRSDNTILFYELGKNGIINFSDSVAFSLPSELEEIYGFCMYKNPDNKLYAIANSKSGVIKQWLIEISNGNYEARLSRILRLSTQPEGMVADDLLKKLYIGEERKGIHVFAAEPDTKDTSYLIEASDSTNPYIVYDIEGLAIYPESETERYLVASSQGNFSYAIFNINTETYLGSFVIEDDVIDGVEETDGLEIYSKYISEKYPLGILVVQDGFNYDDSIKKAQNFKLVDWRKVDTILSSF